MNKTFRKMMLPLAILLLAGFVLTACGAKGSASTAPVDVNVTLTEFTIEPSMTTFKVGVPYHFVITNEGKVPHEFDIIPPESPPVSADQEKSASLARVTEDQLPAGATATLDYTFTKAYPEGSLEFACHLTGHYEAGMHVPIVVQ